jgi:FAD/FMN-containing dehydrogenase
MTAPATTVYEASTALSAESLAGFRAALRGQLLVPGDVGYDTARMIWNKMIDRRPQVIARCTGPADVIAAVTFGRDHDLLIAIHGGGHGVAGYASCDDGLKIDLSPMKDIHVDPQRRTARAQGGVTWGDLDRETQVFGLAAPGGIVSTTGIAGLTLGGGYGWLRRKHGLSCDNLISVEIVTADGRLLTASEHEHADLFWAVRGGGGNFGVVTSFEYRLHPVGPQVLFLGVMYPIEQAPQLLPRWRDFMASAPDAFSGNAMFWTIPEGSAFPPELYNRAVFFLPGVYAGPVEEGERLLQPLRTLAEPLLDMSGVMPFTSVQTLFDWVVPDGERLTYWKSLFLHGLDEATMAELMRWVLKRPVSSALVDLWWMDGAVGRVGADATPMGDRQSPITLVFNTIWDDPDTSDANIAWTRAFYEAMRPHSPGGSYLNFPGFGEEGEDLVRRSYGANYARLAAVKATYDPSNLFRLNQNIPPAVPLH